MAEYASRCNQNFIRSKAQTSVVGVVVRYSAPSVSIYGGKRFSLVMLVFFNERKSQDRRMQKADHLTNGVLSCAVRHNPKLHAHMTLWPSG